MNGQLSMGGTRRLNRHYQSQNTKHVYIFNEWEYISGTSLKRYETPLIYDTSYFKYRYVDITAKIPEGITQIELFVNFDSTVGNILIVPNSAWNATDYKIVITGWKNDATNQSSMLLNTGVSYISLSAYSTIETIPQNEYNWTIDTVEKYGIRRKALLQTNQGIVKGIIYATGAVNKSNCEIKVTFR